MSPPPPSMPPPPRPAPPPATLPAGWYADPWDGHGWRWWDGSTWTAHASSPTKNSPTQQPNPIPAPAPTTTKPRLPSWLSVPVIVGAIPSIPLLIFYGVTQPLSILLGIVPFIIVAPVLIWLDRIEPEPRSARVHAFLWGAFVAGAVAFIINSIVALTISEVVAAVVSAPVVEEGVKALAIVWAVRRHQVDGIMDGIIYAGWAALGFAVIEDVSYFADAAAGGDELLMQTFIGRALFTPFAHPLFTAWTGLAIGIAVRKRKSLLTAWWGLPIAIILHAAWNGSLTLAQDESTVIVTIVALIGFVILFLAAIVVSIVLRRRDQQHLKTLLPWLVERYEIDPILSSAAADLGQRRRTRKALANRQEKQTFDLQVGAISRLAAFFDNNLSPDVVTEARLVTQLRSSLQR